MTAQIPDYFQLNYNEFDVTGVNGSGLFDPLYYGLTPIGINSMCWRGQICKYELVQKNLVMRDLWVSNGKLEKGVFQSQTGPIINDIQPISGERSDCHFNCWYRNLNIQVAFTGGLLLGKDFFSDRYEWIAFRRPWQFQIAFELIFDDGRLKCCNDISQTMERVRDQVEEKLLSPFIDERHQAREWIKETFNLDYHF